MNNKWTRTEILCLIEAWQEESNLYVVKSPQYHNKKIRSASLRRVMEAVRALRPNVTEKVCQVKFNNLRTQYVSEYAKTMASKTSGCSTDNIYEPSLWYFANLQFLDGNFVPRKSRASPLDSQNILIESQAYSEMSNTEISELLAISVVKVKEEEANVTEPMPQPLVKEFLPLSASTSLLESPSGGASGDSTFVEESVQGPSISKPVPYGEKSELGSGTRKSKKRKEVELGGAPSYVGAIQSIAESLNRAEPEKGKDSIQACTDFIACMLREFEDPQLKLEVMNTLTQTVINARMVDITRSPHK